MAVSLNKSTPENTVYEVSISGRYVETGLEVVRIQYLVVVGSDTAEAIVEKLNALDNAGIDNTVSKYLMGAVMNLKAFFAPSEIVFVAVKNVMVPA